MLSDGVSTFRLISRDDSLCFDQAFTLTGFSGVEDTDWANIDSAELPLGLGSDELRVGVRNTYWVIDQVYETIPPDSGPGFSGDEGLEWDNVEQHQLP